VVVVVPKEVVQQEQEVLEVAVVEQRGRLMGLEPPELLIQEAAAVLGLEILPEAQAVPVS
jgi:hypothetical protein